MPGTNVRVRVTISPLVNNLIQRLFAQLRRQINTRNVQNQLVNVEVAFENFVGTANFAQAVRLNSTLLNLVSRSFTRFALLYSQAAFNNLGGGRDFFTHRFQLNGQIRYLLADYTRWLRNYEDATALYDVTNQIYDNQRIDGVGSGAGWTHILIGQFLEGDLQGTVKFINRVEGSVGRIPAILNPPPPPPPPTPQIVPRQRPLPPVLTNTARELEQTFGPRPGPARHLALPRPASPQTPPLPAAIPMPPAQARAFARALRGPPPPLPPLFPAVARVLNRLRRFPPRFIDYLIPPAALVHHRYRPATRAYVRQLDAIRRGVNPYPRPPPPIRRRRRGHQQRRH